MEGPGGHSGGDGGPVAHVWSLCQKGFVLSGFFEMISSPRSSWMKAYLAPHGDAWGTRVAKAETGSWGC